MITKAIVDERKTQYTCANCGYENTLKKCIENRTVVCKVCGNETDMIVEVEEIEGGDVNENENAKMPAM